MLSMPIVLKPNNINVHKQFFYNTKGLTLVSDLKADFKKLNNFDCTLDDETNKLYKEYEYKHSLKIYSKNISALHIDGDNCINYLVNVDDKKSTFAAIISSNEYTKLRHSKIHDGNLEELLDHYNISNVFYCEVKPGEILVFDSNDYHSFNCGTGINLLVHKFRNNILKNTMYNPVYL